MTTVTPRISREEKSRANDEAIRAALIGEISSVGWDAATVSGIAKSAGVSVGAVYARAETLSELANQLWVSTLKFRFEDFFDAVADTLEEQEPNKLIELSELMQQHQADYSVALELVIASLFDDELEEVIGQEFAQSLNAAVTRESSVHSAAITLAFGLLLGQAMARKHSKVEILSEHDARLLCSYWRSEYLEVDTSRQIPLNPYRDSELQTGNNNSLSILRVVAKRGYRKATVSRIARALGMTPGGLFGGHKSKAELIGQAAKDILMTPMDVWKQYSFLMDSGSSPLARALFLREYMNPCHEDYWKIALELARVGESYPELSDFRTPADPLQRTHLAMALIAAFSPESWKLPFYGPFLNGTAT